MIDNRFHELISHLWRGGKYSYLYTTNDGNGDKLSWWLSLPLPADFEVPKLFLNTDAYFAVNPAILRKSQHERAKIKDGFDIAAINCLYFEIDCKTDEQRKAALAWLAAWEIKPACVIFSGGGFHVYVWLTVPFILDTPEKQQRAMDLQWAMVKLAGGDTAVNDLSRVLRIPGTTNFKKDYAPNFPTVAIEQWEPTAQYELADLEPLLQPYIDARDAAKAHTPHTPSGGSVSLSDSELLDVLFKSKNGSQYEALWRGDLSSVGDDHSRADQILANGLAWLTGRDLAAMDRLFRQSGLYRKKWETASYRERTLNNAANSAQTVYTPSQIDPDAVKAAQSAVNMNGTGNSNTTGSQSSSNGASAPQPPKGLTSTQQTTIDFLFAAGDWDLLAAICAKIPVKHGRPYLKSKFLAMHNGDADKANEELKKYRFAGMPVSEQAKADLVRWGYAFSENELDGTVYVNGQPLDEAIRAEINLHGRDDGYGGKGQPSLTTLPEAILVMARSNIQHPVRDWLKGLTWDGKSHLAELIRYFKDGHAPIVYPDGTTMSVFGAFLKRWMLGAVARTFGDKDAQNPVLVLAGSQGIGKSYFPKWLCSGISDYFIEGAIDPENPDHKRLLVTRFIWEISELPSTMNKTDANGLKSFLTTGDATFRVPYAKDSVTRPALASFVGTLNPTTGHLIDVTGNRRFLSIELEAIDKSYSQAIDVSQFWAEAVHYFQHSASYRLSPVEEQAQNALNDASRMTNDTAEALLKYYDIDPTQTGWFEYTIDIAETLREKGHRTGVTPIGTELRGMLGYAAVERRLLGRKGKGFFGIQRK